MDFELPKREPCVFKFHTRNAPEEERRKKKEDSFFLFLFGDGINVCVYHSGASKKKRPSYFYKD